MGEHERQEAGSREKKTCIRDEREQGECLIRSSTALRRYALQWVSTSIVNGQEEEQTQ